MNPSWATLPSVEKTIVIVFSTVVLAGGSVEPQYLENNETEICIRKNPPIILVRIFSTLMIQILYQTSGQLGQLSTGRLWRSERIVYHSDVAE
jgi:hypothetical protein